MTTDLSQRLMPLDALPLFLTTDQVATVIGLDSGAAFLRQRGRLETETLFPLAMPHARRPFRWKADEVLAWVDRHGRPAAPDVAPELIATGKVVMLEKARTA